MVICWGTKSLRFYPKKSLSGGILQIRGQRSYLLSETVEPFKTVNYSKEEIERITAKSTRNGGSLQPWEWQLYGWDKN